MSKATMAWDSQSRQYQNNPLIGPLLPSAVDQEICEFLQELNQCTNLGLTTSELVSLAKGNFGSENSAVHCPDYPDCDVTSPKRRSEFHCHVIPIQPKRKHDILFLFNKKHQLVRNLNEFFRGGNVRLSLLKMKPEIHINGPKSTDSVMKVTSLVQQMGNVKDILNWLVELGAPPIPGVDIDDDEFVVKSASPNLSPRIIVNESSPASQVASKPTDRVFSVKSPTETLKSGKSTGTGERSAAESTTNDRTDQILKGCIVCGKKPQAGSVFCIDDFKNLKAGLVAKAKQLPGRDLHLRLEEDLRHQ